LQCGLLVKQFDQLLTLCFFIGKKRVIIDALPVEFDLL